MKYEKLFPESKWFIKFYRTCYGRLEIAPPSSDDDVEIQLSLIEVRRYYDRQYLEQPVSQSIYEIGDDLIRDIFKPQCFFSNLMIM